MDRHITQKLSIRDIATQVVQLVLPFWEKAMIPTRPKQHCISQLEKLFEEWRILKKHQNCVTPGHKLKEAEFVDRLEDLFDVAQADALSMIKIPEDRAFLIAQREKGRRGVTASAEVRGYRTADRYLRISMNFCGYGYHFRQSHGYGIRIGYGQRITDCKFA